MHADLLRELLAERTESRLSESELLRRADILGLELKSGESLHPKARRDVESDQPDLSEFGPVSLKAPPSAEKFSFQLAAVEVKPSAPPPDPETVLSGFTPYQADDQQSIANSKAREALLNTNQLAIIIDGLLSVSKTAKQLDVRRIVGRIARQRRLAPLPCLSAHTSDTLGLVLMDHAPELMEDQLTLFRQLQSLPANCRPVRSLRMSTPPRGGFRDIKNQHIKDIPGRVEGRVLVVGNPLRPSAELRDVLQQLQLSATSIFWLSTASGSGWPLWDRPAIQSSCSKPLDWLLPLCSAVSLTTHGMLRALRRELGASLEIESELINHSHVQWQKLSGYGNICNAYKSQYQNRLLKLHRENADLTARCVARLWEYLQFEPLHYRATAAPLLHQICPDIINPQQLDEIQRYIAELGASILLNKNANPAEKSLLEFGRHIGESVTVSESTKAAVIAAQQRWQQRENENPALIGSHPAAGLGEAKPAELYLLGDQLLIDKGVSCRVSLSAFECPEKGAVWKSNNKNSHVALEKPWPLANGLLDSGSELISISTFESKQLWWADAVHQGNGGLVVTVSDHEITLGAEDAFAPLWPGDALPQIDDIGLYVDQWFAGVVQRFRYCPPGRFLMGSPKDEPGRLDNETQHQVALSRGFWMADTAVTQELWQAISGENPSEFANNVEHPVENVSWEDVQQFIRRLNQLYAGADYILPTEAQWEYACRAGSDTAFWWGDELSPSQARYDWSVPYNKGSSATFEDGTVPVKSFETNPWGMYQMHGNVWEWCDDWYSDYPKTFVRDPTGPKDGGRRVLRGGGWISFGVDLRSAQRDHDPPVNRGSIDGFRLCQPVPAPGVPSGKPSSTSQTDARPPAGEEAAGSGVRSK